jgi:hypothetical protein
MNKKKDLSKTNISGETKPQGENDEISTPTGYSNISDKEVFIDSTKSKEAAPPHKEQLKYWKKDLRLKKVTLGFSFLIVVSIVINTYQSYISAEQLRLNTEQSKRLAKSLCMNLQSSLLSHVTNLDKIFLDRTYLRPYFYEGKRIDLKDKYYREVSATAELILDVLDMISDQNKAYVDCWDDPEAWDQWVIDSFSTSPILRETLEKRRNWYGRNLLNLYEKSLQEGQR